MNLFCPLHVRYASRFGIFSTISSCAPVGLTSLRSMHAGTKYHRRFPSASILAKAVCAAAFNVGSSFPVRTISAMLPSCVCACSCPRDTKEALAAAAGPDIIEFGGPLPGGGDASPCAPPAGASNPPVAYASPLGWNWLGLVYADIGVCCGITVV